MSAFVYTGWFRNTHAAPQDEDHEWCACFVIEAADDAAARAWGERLSRDFSRRHEGEVFLNSEIEGPVDGADHANLPQVVAGQSAPDDVIGW